MNRLTAILISVCLVSVFVTIGWSIEPESNVEIMINNPYSFDVRAEVKCDWDDNKKDFRFHNEYTFKKHNRIFIKVPSTNRHCEIWPKVLFFH